MNAQIKLSKMEIIFIIIGFNVKIMQQMKEVLKNLIMNIILKLMTQYKLTIIQVNKWLDIISNTVRIFLVYFQNINVQ